MDIQGLLVAFITNVSLILVSIIIIIWVVSLYFKKKSKKWYHFIMLIGAVVTIVLCMRAIKANYDYYDKWNKILRVPYACYITDIHLSKKEMQEDFKEITEIVNKNYKQIASHKAIRIDSLNDVFRKRVEKIENGTQYGMILLEYFASLKNAHTFPYFLNRSADITLTMRNDSIWVVACNDSIINARTGDLLLSVNNISIEKYINQQLLYISASTDMSRKRTAVLNALSSYTDAFLNIRLKRNDSIFEEKIPLLKQEEKQNKSIHTAKTDQYDKLTEYFSMIKELKKENIGYIRFNNFYKDEVEWFMEQLDYVINDSPVCTHLILDLRDNHGGELKGCIQIARKLLFNTTASIARLSIKGDSTAYKGKIYILQNNNTSSAAEKLIALLKQRKQVISNGQQTNGDCGSTAYNYKTSHGIEFRLATEKPTQLPDGSYTEGEGFFPDIYVKESLPWENLPDEFDKAMELIKSDKLRRANNE